MYMCTLFLDAQQFSIDVHQLFSESFQMCTLARESRDESMAYSIQRNQTKVGKCSPQLLWILRMRCNSGVFVVHTQTPPVALLSKGDLVLVYAMFEFRWRILDLISKMSQFFYTVSPKSLSWVISSLCFRVSCIVSSNPSLFWSLDECNVSGGMHTLFPNLAQLVPKAVQSRLVSQQRIICWWWIRLCSWPLFQACPQSVQLLLIAALFTLT